MIRTYKMDINLFIKLYGCKFMDINPFIKLERVAKEEGPAVFYVTRYLI